MANKWNNLQRQNNKNTSQSIRSFQETSLNYNGRENKVNGFAGSAASILARFSPKRCVATFGSGSNGNCVGP